MFSANVSLTHIQTVVTNSNDILTIRKLSPFFNHTTPSLCNLNQKFHQNSKNHFKFFSVSQFQVSKPTFSSLTFSKPNLDLDREHSKRYFAVGSSGKKKTKKKSLDTLVTEPVEEPELISKDDKDEYPSKAIIEDKEPVFEPELLSNYSIDATVEKDENENKNENENENESYEIPLFEDYLEEDEDMSVHSGGEGEEDEEYFEDDIWGDFEEGYEPKLGDGRDGGGIVLGEKPWCKLVEEFCVEVLKEKTFNDDLQLFALKVNADTGLVQVRLDKMSNIYGSPSMDEVEKFSQKLYAKFDLAEREGLISSLALEVSSPGADRVVRVPQDLERFAKLAMVVKYVNSEEKEVEEIFELVEVNNEEESTTWKLADIRKNRELMGKGRQLNKKQRERRVIIPFESLTLVKIHIDI